jgi:hypothetical protein
MSRVERTVAPRRCPACGALPERYWEPWTGGVEFLADDQGRPSKEGNVIAGLPRGGVRAECVCGRKWWLRGVSQITELEPQP